MEKSVHNEQYIHLLRWLRRHRLAAGLSMRSLGNRMEVPHSWVEKVEQGERRLDLVEYNKLCAALECDPHEGLQFLNSSKITRDIKPDKKKNPRNPSFALSKKKNRDSSA